MNLKIYGADWCIDCINIKKFLDAKHIEYDYIDITNNNEAVSVIEKINNGKRIIPTLIIDGVAYSNPNYITLNKIINKNT
ncbi:MAG: NrdH-redoxin [Flavobacteriales bacterium]|nr:NrdH-redoxin [Flavobacteriales bacterium]